MEWNGAPGVDRLKDNQGVERDMFLPLHGHVANLPAHFLSVTVGETPSPHIVVRAVLDEARLFGPGFRLESELVIHPGEPSLLVRDRVTNRRAVPAEFQMLYHLNFGAPLLGDGATFDAPYKVVAPRDTEAARGIRHFNRFGPPVPGWVEQCYYLELRGRGKRREAPVLLTAPGGDTAVELTLSTRAFPCFSLWKNTGTVADGYVTGLEPATNFPNHRSVERRRGRVGELTSGGSWTGELHFRLLQGRREVSRVRTSIRKEAARGTVSKTPLNRFSG